jgi:protein TonB
VVDVTPEPRAPALISITAARDRQPAPPAPDRPQDEVKPVTPPISQVVMPQPKLVVSQAPPVATAPERLPEPPKPAQAAAPAPPAPAAPAAASGPPGPVRVANLSAIMTYGPPPPYPAASKHKKETGTVVVRVVISEQGTVMEATIRQSSGFSALDEAALNAVRRYRFSPTIRDGRPVVASGSIAMPFKLKTS